MIINSTLFYLTTSNLLSSPFFMQSSSSGAQQISFQHSSLHRFSTHFFYSSTSFNNIFKKNIFVSNSFSKFLETPIKFEETHITNVTYTSQKSVSVYSDIFISSCAFNDCHSKSSPGGALSVSTPSSKVKSEDVDDSIQFQLKFSTFYNCSAVSSGALFVQFPGDVKIYSICFNSCESTISNQAGSIDITTTPTNLPHIDIQYISFFKCPESSSEGKRNCFLIKAEKLTFPIKYFNSSFNNNNNEKGCVLTLTGLKDVEITFPIIINNSGSDAFSMLRVASLALIDGLFTYNSFSIAPFNSYGSITVMQPYQIFLSYLDYLYNDVSQERSVTGSIIIYVVKCKIDPPSLSFGKDVLLSLYNTNDTKIGSLTNLNGRFFPDSCFFVSASSATTVSKSIKNKSDFILYIVIGACSFVIVCISIILIVYCVIKKKKIKKWIEVNESDQQNSISSTTFTENLLEDPQ